MKLLDKEYLNFDEVLSRWNWKELDLHHFIATEQIIPAVILSETESYPGDIWRGGSYVGDIDGATSHLNCHDQFDNADDGPNHYENWPQCGRIVYCHKPYILGPNDYSFSFFSESPERAETKQWFRFYGDCLICNKDVGKERFIFKQSDIQRVEGAAAQEANTNLGPKSEGAYLNIIGALLGLMLEKKDANGKRFATFADQNNLIQTIQDHYGDTGGLSESNLQKKFAEARKAINSK